MELVFKDGRYTSIWRYTPKDYARHATAHHSGKYYIQVDNGVLIIPEDFSYTQFINNTWYERDYPIISDAVQSGV
jgi:hypothetical protein